LTAPVSFTNAAEHYIPKCKIIDTDEGFLVVVAVSHSFKMLINLVSESSSEELPSAVTSPALTKIRVTRLGDSVQQALNFFNHYFFLKYTQWQCILSYDNRTAV
jgi:hypothetical protein